LFILKRRAAMLSNNPSKLYFQVHEKGGNNMEWKDLSTTSANVLERCWGLYDDDPRSVHISIGEKFKVWENEYTFTEENYNEIIEYVKDKKEIEVSRSGIQVVITGIGQFGSWLKEEE
jgi:hypothetical protein